MDEKRSLTNFSYIGIGRFAAILLQALFYLLFASLLGPEIYGKLSIILAFAATFSIVSSFGLNLSLQVYRAKNNTKLSAQITTLFLISTSGAAIILLFIDQFAAILCIGLSLFSMSQAYLLGLKQYKKFMIYSIIKSSTFFVIPIVLYFVLEIPGIVLGMAISHFLASIPFFKVIKIKSLSGIQNYYKVLIHNFGVTSGAFLPFVLDKLLIGYLFGFFITGIYQFNLHILIALGSLPGVLGAYLVSEEASGVRHRKLSNLTILVSVILAGVAIILAPYLINQFFPKYSEGIFSLQILILSIIPQTFSAIYSSKLLAIESTKIGYTSLVHIGSILILIVFLGDLYGLVGLALAVLFSITITTIFTFILYSQLKKN